MGIYILDSNFFIQAHKVSYPFDVAISFWDKVKQLAESEQIISIDKVKDEIFRNEDDLTQWCNDNLPENFFKDTDEIIEEYARVIQWANAMNHHYKQSAIEEFLTYELADAWLVAYALADKENRTIVTHETSEPHRKNKIKIPDACINFEVNYTNTVGLFRELGESF